MSFTPVRTKLITKQHIKLQMGKPYYFGFLSNMYLAEKIEHASQEDKKQPTVVDVLDFDTGEMGTIILSAVAVSELSKHYPMGIKGVSIEMTLIAPRDGKSYNLCNLAEIQPPEQFAAALASWDKVNTPAPPPPAKKK